MLVLEPIARKMSNFAQRVKKSAEKNPSKAAAASTPKRWPPAKDVKADVEFIFQKGLDSGEEMTMGKIYAELGVSCFTTL